MVFKNITVLLVGVLFSTLAFSDCQDHIQHGIPQQSDYLLCKGAFVIGYDIERKIPDFAAYRLTNESVRLYVPRTNKFEPDDQIPAEHSASLKNYYRSGFDRGHLAPAASIDIDSYSLEESFELTNIAPQLPGLNRQGIKAAESAIRSMAIAYGEVFVITGTMGSFSELTEALQSTKAAAKGRIIAMPNTEGLGLDGGVTIPAYFYKAYFVPSTKSRGIYIFPHIAISSSDIHDYHYDWDKGTDFLGFDPFNKNIPVNF